MAKNLVRTLKADMPRFPLRAAAEVVEGEAGAQK